MFPKGYPLIVPVRISIVLSVISIGYLVHLHGHMYLILKLYGYLLYMCFLGIHYLNEAKFDRLFSAYYFVIILEFWRINSLTC